jgi:hypothetical protein
LPPSVPHHYHAQWGMFKRQNKMRVSGSTSR